MYDPKLSTGQKESSESYQKVAGRTHSMINREMSPLPPPSHQMKNSLLLLISKSIHLSLVKFEFL